MRVWGFLFSSLRFLEKLLPGLLVQISQNTLFSLYLFYNHPHSPLKISLSFLPLFSKKLNSPPSRSVLAWPLFDQNGDTRDTNIWSAREYRHSHTQKHIYSINIMFAATQQIASIAGLKATKVQVRALSSSSSQYSFSGKDLVAFGARARVSLWIHFLRIQL